jgi:hypothetical protein
MDNGDYTGSPAEILPAGGEQQKRMSTIKNPEEKKRLSLERDRRNQYGENDKASRKAIRAESSVGIWMNAVLLARCLAG